MYSFLTVIEKHPEDTVIVKLGGLEVNLGLGCCLVLLQVIVIRVCFDNRVQTLTTDYICVISPSLFVFLCKCFNRLSDKPTSRADGRMEESGQPAG